MSERVSAEGEEHFYHDDYNKCHECARLYIEELKRNNSVLISSLSMALDSKRRKLYFKELNETLNKYINGNK